MTKRKLVLSVVAVAVVAAAGITAVVLSTGGEPAARPCDIPDSVREQPASAKTAPGGGGIEVAEKGVSSTGLVSMGAVLRNTSDRVAYRTRVALEVNVSVDGLPPGPVQGPLMTMEIPVLVPGQRVGIGRPLIKVTATNKVTSADVDPQTTTWLPAGALGGFSPVTDTYESTSRVKAALPADAVRYTERSANCRALASRRTAVVFRDTTGKIVGDGLLPPDGRGNPAGSPQQRPASPSCSPGERSTWIVPLQDIPPETDDSRTELYSYCDLNLPPSDVNDAD
ncbi:hypothetical protein VA596_49295 [Amycolatopsis sp., V23-08]|uniref:Uncharacterized protein n=1 Tax=Amycolatopsis heterodermiae TaxID=3110235 RepID=A0ABU5RP71_9PSEU|nr:hypothetical protein [Amycolatopsis sp., V23-08]MEA5367604.1 hypothetical protein [Amycolatopsis sp., V23-08]